MSSKPLRLLLLAIAIEVFGVVFALSSSGLQIAAFIIGIVGLVVAFVGVGARDQP
jgi:hypothetical protein